MTVLAMTKAINSFAESAPVPFRAYAGATVQSEVEHADRPWVTVREIDRDDIGASSDISDTLWECYFDLFISARTEQDLEAVEREILRRQHVKFGTAPNLVVYIFSDNEVVDDGRKNRSESILELRAFINESYTPP